MIAQKTEDDNIDFHNMKLVSYNFEFKQPYEYFKHFFLYEKPY